MTYLILLLALTALILGADLLVRGSVNLASALGVPTLIIGLTIVAWGTSAPELVVSLTAGLQGEYGIALGNIVGSNLANILLIGGVAAALMPLSTAAVGLRFNTLLLVLVSMVLSAMVISGHLNPFIGAALIAIKAFSLVKSFRGCVAPKGEEVQPEAMGPWRAATLALGGAILVGGGGYALVESAEELAHLWGVPSAVIGLSIIAVGTSLPELAATIAAVRQRQGDLIMGNIIGSNLANILIVLGFTALFAPGRIHDAGAYIPLLILMMVATLILTGFVLARRSMGRPMGIALLIAYAIFILVSFLIGSGPIHD